jgi:hypothetical protein
MIQMSAAEFLDGPLAGTTRTFDRPEPPKKIYCDSEVLGHSVTYVRDINPFGDGEQWIYMLEISVPEEEPT